MGCCQSRERSPYNPPQPAQSPADSAVPRDSSRAAINQPSRSISNVSSQPPSANTRPNLPIRPPTPVQKSPSKVSNQPPPWTRKHLEREREAFFDTRVSGIDEIWKAMRIVCEMVRRGETAEGQGILDALNVTCPTGRVARDRGKHRERGGVFDERGVLYDIPAWVVTDPQDIVEDQEKSGDVDGASDNDPDEDIAAASPPKSEKGKGRAEDLGEMVTLRARLSHTGNDIKLNVGMKERIADIVRKIQQQTGSKRVRLMYLGRTMDERLTLEQTTWKQGHVVNAMVFEGDEGMLSKRST